MMEGSLAVMESIRSYSLMEGVGKDGREVHLEEGLFVGVLFQRGDIVAVVFGGGIIYGVGVVFGVIIMIILE